MGLSVSHSEETNVSYSVEIKVNHSEEESKVSRSEEETKVSRSEEESKVRRSEEIQLSCSVEIQISNETKNIVLKEPRTFFKGYCLRNPEPSVPPGSSTTCKFKSTESEGCKGVLVFEAESFTLAIYFFNPIDHNRFSPEMGLELSLDKIHKGNLKETYERLARISRGRSSEENLMFPSVILKESQETAQLNAGPVKVTATMSQGRDTVIKVKVEEQRSSTAASDCNWLCPEMDLEQILDKAHKRGPEAAYQCLLRMGCGDDIASIILRELLAEMSISPVNLTSAMSRVQDAVIKVKEKMKKSPGTELEAGAWHFQK